MYYASTELTTLQAAINSYNQTVCALSIKARQLWLAIIKPSFAYRILYENKYIEF